MTGGGRAAGVRARAAAEVGPHPVERRSDAGRAARERGRGEVERRREALASEGERPAVVDVGGSRAGGRVGGVAGSRRAGGVVVVVVGDVVLERAREAARAVAIASAAPAFAVAARCGVLGARAARAVVARQGERVDGGSRAIHPGRERAGPRAVPEPALRARPRRVGRAQAERPERPERGSSSRVRLVPSERRSRDRKRQHHERDDAAEERREMALAETAERGVVPQRFRLAAHRDEI